MRRMNPADVIENFRRGRQRRFPFTWADLGMALIGLAFLLAIGYITFMAKPELPALIKLNTLTPTLPVTATMILTATPTASIVDTAPAATATLFSTAPNQPTLAPTTVPTETTLPSATPTETPAPTETETATPTETVTPSATPILTREYIVQEGDTLSGIALKFGVTVEEIVQLNHLKSASFIYVGQKLLIPIK